MRLTFFVVLLAGCAAVVGTAAAQQAVRLNETYCLEVGDQFGGTQPLLCRFTTYEQCLASRTAPGDRCLLNPYLAFQQRR